MRDHRGDDLGDAHMSVPELSPDAWAEEMAEQARRTQELADRMADLSVSASGSGDLVEVTVSGSGLMTGLRLDAEALRWGPLELADEILAVQRLAQSRLTPLVEHLAQQTLGEQSAFARDVVSGFVSAFGEPSDGRDRNGW